MSANKGGRAAILLIFVGTLGAGSLAYYVKNTPNASHVPDDIRIEKPKHHEKLEETGTKPRAEATKPSTAETVRLPVFGGDISDMALGKTETPVPSGEKAMNFVAQQVAEASKFEGVRVLGVDVRDHVAIVNFNEAVGKGMGSMEEGAFFQGLQLAFGQFTDIDKVSVEKEGQTLQSGHFDTTEPLPVIRPGEKPPADSSNAGNP